MEVHRSMVVTEGFRAGSWRERKRKEEGFQWGQEGPGVKTVFCKSSTKHRVLEPSIEEKQTGQPARSPVFPPATPFPSLSTSNPRPETLVSFKASQHAGHQKSLTGGSRKEKILSFHNGGLCYHMPSPGQAWGELAWWRLSAKQAF